MTGEELKILRKNLGLKQAEIAPLLGITVDAVSMMERGKINMSRPVEMLALYMQLKAQRRD